MYRIVCVRQLAVHFILEEGARLFVIRVRDDEKFLEGADGSSAHECDRFDRLAWQIGEPSAPGVIEVGGHGFL